MKFLKIIIFAVILSSSLFANERYLDSLTDINGDLKKYFPRWKITEPDLQFQIYQSFLQLGYNKDSLDKQNIIILAAPKNPFDGKEFDILLLSCGVESMNSQILDRELPTVANVLSGKKAYREATFIAGSHQRGDRDYSYQDIPVQVPVEEDQGVIMVDYLNRPKGVNQAMVLSLYEQSLKIGNTGFWLSSQIGNDRVGLPFWLAGESSIQMKYDLYLNNDPNTSVRNPELLKIALGGTYRLNTGINNSGLLEIIPERQLNSHPSGKINFGLEYNFPFHPQAGISLNYSTPLQKIQTETIDADDFYLHGGASASDDVANGDLPGFDRFANDEREGNLATNNQFRIAPVLETTGQLTAFYNLWIDENKAENFFRLELGVSYSEIREYLFYTQKFTNEEGEEIGAPLQQITQLNTSGVGLVHPDELADWIFAKIEYRNQAVYPFSVSAQYSNQILLTRAFVKLFGNWLFLEAKYAKPLRDPLPYELDNFFMISPVLRITI
ncbi:hypothetical protein OAQ99_03585 [Candidatus Kapabacteria bacterium]|nr:hypothetical protein [Candidatus Kapabacteria bacterium]